MHLLILLCFFFSFSQQQGESVKGKDKLFDGSVSGTISLNLKDNSLSSNDLLSKIRSRKRISALAQEADEEVGDDDFLRPDYHQHNPIHKSIDPKDEELLRDIHSYITFMAAREGEASTQEIVLNFGDRLPKSDAPKFKAMLNQICSFDGNKWRVKLEYRWYMFAIKGWETTLGANVLYMCVYSQRKAL